MTTSRDGFVQAALKSIDALAAPQPADVLAEPQGKSA